MHDSRTTRGPGARREHEPVTQPPCRSERRPPTRPAEAAHPDATRRELAAHFRSRPHTVRRRRTRR